SFTGTGTETANTIVGGGSGTNVLYGLGGDDILQGGYGKNYLYGGEGNDTIRPSTGHIALSEGIINGGGGFDTVDFSRFDGNITYDLATKTLSARASDGLSVEYVEHAGFQSIEKINGTSHGDVFALRGDVSDLSIPFLDGGEGTDKLDFSGLEGN